MNSRTSNVTWKKDINRYFHSFEFENVVRRLSKFKIENTNQLYMYFLLNCHTSILIFDIFAVLNLKML